MVGCRCSVSLGVWRAPGDLVKKPVVRIPPDGLELDGLFGVVGGGEMDLGDTFGKVEWGGQGARGVGGYVRLGVRVSGVSGGGGWR